MGVIFSKTSKGREEIETRSGELTPRVRRVLILVDGKRTVEELRALLSHDDLQHTLGMLEEDGYIEIATVANAAQERRKRNKSLRSVTAFRSLRAGFDPMDLAKARNFMTNTLNAFVGSLGASSLLERIDHTRNHAELRELFGEWYSAIVLSRDGKREAEALRADLLKVL